MSKDPFEDPEFKAWLKRAKEEMFPKMKESALSVTIFNSEPDPKLCIEVGAAVLFDKPLIILAPNGAKLPANLKRLASAIIFGSPSEESTIRELNAAVTRVLTEDQRAKTKG